MTQNHWPRQLHRLHPRLVESMVRELTRVCDDAASLIAEMSARFRYEDYAERVRAVAEDAYGARVSR